MKKIISILFLLASFTINSQTSRGTSLNNWQWGGNTINSYSTASIGLKNNRSLLFKTNGAVRMKLDSLGFLSVSTNSYNNIFKIDNDGVYSLGAKSPVGSDNTVYGSLAMPVNTAGIENSAFGRGALYVNTSGNANSAFGQVALVGVTTGSGNVGFGKASGYGISTGFRNTCIGNFSGFNNNGNQNVILGFDAMYNSTSASSNVVVGASSYYDGTGNKNTILGYATAQSMSTGSANTIVGSSVNIGNVFNNVAISNGTGQVVYRDNGTTAYNLRPIAVGTTVTPTETLTVNGNVGLTKLVGKSTTTTIARGTGLGTGTGTLVTLTRATDLAGIIGVTTGSTALGTSTVLATVSFTSAYGAIPHVILTPANLAARNLIVGQDVFISANTSTFAVNTNTVALTASTTYSWFYHVTQ